MRSNVRAMLEYVKGHPGSSLTLIVRSSEHPGGATRLWNSLKKEFKDSPITILPYP